MLFGYLEKFGTSFENKGDQLSHLDDLVAFIREKSKEDRELFLDDYNYNHIKFTIIPKGTMFYRRQPDPTFNNTTPRSVWLDYTGTMATTPFSFLTDTNEIYTQEYLDKVKTHFGDNLLILRPKKDLLIINFPYYVTSYIEGFIRRICVDLGIETCVDGYTMDLLQFNPNKIFKPLPSLTGFRELCVLDARNLEFVALVTPPPVITPPRPPPLLSIKPAAFSNQSRGSSTRSTRSSRSSSNKSRGSSTRSSGKKSRDNSYEEYMKQHRSHRYRSPSPRKSHKSLKTTTSPTIVRGRSRIKKVSRDDL